MGLNRSRAQYAHHQHHSMESKKQKIKQLLQKSKSASDFPTWNAAQETYVKRLEGDIERTKKFLEQAKAANNKLSQEVTDDNWDDETRECVELLSLLEVHKLLPYMPMKNDLIGIATAASLTKTAVMEQSQASDLMENEISIIQNETQDIERILEDYKEFDRLLQEKIRRHPAQMESLEMQLHQSRSLEEELEHRLAEGQTAVAKVKKVEERLYQHVKRVVAKLHALLDWENASMMDEDMFKESIKRSLTLINQMVKLLVTHGPSLDKWIKVTAGAPEEKIVQMMMRNNLIYARERNGMEVRLREFGYDG